MRKKWYSAIIFFYFFIPLSNPFLKKYHPKPIKIKRFSIINYIHLFSLILAYILVYTLKEKKMCPQEFIKKEKKSRHKQNEMWVVCAVGNVKKYFMVYFLRIFFCCEKEAFNQEESILVYWLWMNSFFLTPFFDCRLKGQNMGEK